ncbi:MAG: hypothetical protein JXR73_04525, partial [Candidatus Omnitrophica bacterium]|nr:hypothetical protein [Candidatus Omnitrophota bacterium]
QSWVESYARNQGIPMEWAQPKVRKEDYVQFCQRRFKRKNQTGVYFIFKSMEQGPTFRCSAVRWLIHSSIISLIGSFHSTAAWSAPIIKRMLTFKKSLTYFMLPNRRDKLSQ